MIVSSLSNSISKDNILQKDPTLSCIYQDKKGRELTFIPTEEKKGGQALGAIFRKEFSKSNSSWMGKIGTADEEFEDSPYSLRTRTVKEVNLGAVKEKIASDCYRVMGKNLFLVPKTYLFFQSIENSFTKDNLRIKAQKEIGIEKYLWIMSRFLEGYKDINEALTRDVNSLNPIPFADFIIRYNRPPETIYNPEGKLVPLLGFMSMLAVGRALADTDILGGDAGNAGFIWKCNLAGKISHAITVKIDPGYAFQFVMGKESKSSMNNIISTMKSRGDSRWWLDDYRDLQIANSAPSLTIFWKSLTDQQRKEFLQTLSSCALYLENKEALAYLIYREGSFNQKDTEQISKKIADEIIKEMCAWIQLQLKMFIEEPTLIPPHIPRDFYIRLRRSYSDFVGRKEFLEQLETYFDTSSYNQGIKSLALCGIGGIGKSELACTFANKDKCRENFSLIYWIDSETEESLDRSYRELAQFALKIPLEEKETFSIIQQKVHDQLENRTSKKPYLLIFDNVEKELNYPQRGGYILITSQRSDLFKDKIMIPPFSKEEAVNLLKNITLQDDTTSMEELAEKLGYFPLAIEKAAAYMGEELTIQDYLKEIKERGYLLEDEGTDRHKKSLELVLLTTLNTLQTNFPDAFEWFNLCAYFNADRIPVSWIADYLKQKEVPNIRKKAKEILQIFRSYCLIQYDKHEGIFSLHRLMQTVMQSKQQEPQKIYNTALEFIKNKGKLFEEEHLETWKLGKQWHEHGKQILAHPLSGQADAVVRGKIHYALGNIIYIIFRKYADAEKELRSSLLLHEKTYGNNHLDVAKSINNIGSCLEAQGKYVEAIKNFEQALKIRLGILGEDHLDVARALGNIGTCLQFQGKYAEAMKNHEQALKIKQNIAKDLPDIATSLNAIGHCFFFQGKYAEALENYERGLKVQIASLGEEHLRVAVTLTNIGTCLSYQERYDEARKYHERALNIKLKTKKEDHLSIAWSLEGIATCFHYQKNYGKAIEKYEEALGRKQLVLEKYHPKIAECLNYIGLCFSSQGKYDEAGNRFEQAYEIAKKTLGENHAKTKKYLDNLNSNNSSCIIS